MTYVDHIFLMTGAVWPMILVLLLALPVTRAAARVLAPWAALPALLAACIVPAGITSITIPGALLGSEVGLDQTAKTFLLFTAVLWLAAGIYAQGYIAATERTRFFIFLLLTLAGNIRLIIAQDLLGFYFGYALMSFASYGLVVFNQNPAAFRAGRVYIILMVASELLLFAAFVLAADAAGGTSFDLVQAALAQDDNRNLLIALAFTGFGIKTGVLGLHMWLPLAHSQAPSPASAVLSGAMVKVGVLGWLRVLPLGAIAAPQWGEIFIYLGLAAAFYAAFVGLTQNVAKTVLAYSSISQMGLATAAVGMILLAPAASVALLPVVAFFALQHSLNKGALFLGAGLVNAEHRLQARWHWLLLALPAAALAGAPWSSGMLAKLLLKEQAAALNPYWAELLPLVLPFSATATALLLLRFLYLVRPQGAAEATPLKPLLLWPWLLLLLSGQVLPWLFVPEIPKTGLSALWGSSWPIFIALLAAALGLALPWVRNLPRVPPGDVLSLFTALAQSLGGAPRGIAHRASQLRWKSRDAAVDFIQLRAAAALAGIEMALCRWPVAMAATAALTAVLIWRIW